jgi:hypothetical protein
VEQEIKQKDESDDKMIGRLMQALGSDFVDKPLTDAQARNLMQNMATIQRARGGGGGEPAPAPAPAPAPGKKAPGVRAGDIIFRKVGGGDSSAGTGPGAAAEQAAGGSR